MPHVTGIRLIAKGSYHLIRVALASVFLYAGVVKLLFLDAFAEIVSNFGLVHPRLVYTVALLLAVTETIVAVALFFDLRGSLTTIVVLLLLFVGVLSYGIAIGLDIECGCFGPEHPASAGVSLGVARGRDLVMLVLCAYLYGIRYVLPIRKSFNR